MSFSRKVTCPYCGHSDRIPAESWSLDLHCSQCDRGIFAARPAEFTAADFDQRVNGEELPVLVDFWAPWCAPCKAMAPAFEKAALAMESRVRFAKLNTDEAQDIGARYDIRSIPTMILFRDGEEVARHSGAMMTGEIQQWVENQLAA